MKKFKQFLLMLVGIMLALAVPEASALGKAIQEHSLLMSLLVSAGVLYSVMKPKRARSAGGNQVVQCGGVNVTEANGRRGSTVTINDSITGQVLTGASEGTYTAGTCILITSLDDFMAYGFTSTNNAFAIKYVTEFYSTAPVGTQLYLLLVTSATTVAGMSDNTNANGGKKLLLYAAGKITVLGALADDKAVHTGGGTITVTAGINADCYTAATNMKTMEIAFRALQMPFRGIVGASSYSGTASALTDESSGTSNNKCAIFIGDTQVWDATYPSAALGLLMGKVAASAVQEKVSKVKNGPLPINAAYLASTAISASTSDLATIAAKNFITWRMLPQVQGIFFSGDPMMTVSTDDYKFLALGRTIDKAHKIAYQTFVQEVDDDIPTVAGKITVGGNQVDAELPDPGWAASMQQTIIDQLSKTMVANGNCTTASCFIDPLQDVSDDTLDATVTIGSKGYLLTINVNLGF